jgi:hypothetical protein
MLITNSIEKEILKDVLNNPGDAFYENVFSDFLDEQFIEHDFRKPLHNNIIKDLKPYQEKYLSVWKNHWINICLCTKPTDESKAEQYLYNLYSQLGFSKPKNIVWYNNPVEMRNQARNQECNKIRYQIKSPFLNNIWIQPWIEVCFHTVDYVLNRLINQVWTKVVNRSWDQIWRHVLYGQHDHGLAFYAYIMQVLRLKLHKHLISLMFLAQEINWWLLTEQIVYVVKKPKECIVEDGKLIKLVFQNDYTIT